MVSPKEDLIRKNASGYEPVETELRSGKRLVLRPLSPSVRLRSTSMNKVEKILFVLSNGIVQPELNDAERADFLDFNLPDAVETYNRIQHLSAEFDRDVLKITLRDSDGDFMTVLENIAKLRGEK